VKTAFGRHGGYVTIRPLTHEDSVLYFPPEAFGPFRVLHQIGAGALGPVFRAYDPVRDRLVAIKVFRLDVTPELSQAFVRELERLIALNISHPSIAAPIAAGFEGTAAYLAMEYAVGDALDVTSRSSPMPLSDAVRIVVSLAAAIDACGDLGVHHELLHPRDIVISADGARVTGFGIAEALSRIGVRLPIRRPYAAPEGPSDIYSLAVIAYELISGRRMTRGGWDELSAEDGPELRDAFAAALSDDPKARPSRAGEFAGKLRRAANISVGEATESRELIQQEEPEAALDRFADLGAVADLQMDFAEPIALEEPVGVSAATMDEPPASPFPASWDAQPPRVFQAEEPESKTGHRLRAVALFLIAGLAVGLLAGYVLKSRRVTPQPAQTKPAVASTTVELPAASPSRSTPAPAPTPAAVPPEPALPAPMPSRPASGVTAAPPSRPAPQPAAGRGRMVIRSTPADATVTVNGQARGRTPLTVRDLALGSYNIHVARDGFSAVDRRVRLTAGSPSASLVIPLKKASAPAKNASGAGSLAVDSRPAGARVFVNDRLVGVTPLAIPGLPAGPATVRIEMDGYQSWATTVRVNAGEQTRVGASLDRK
jgi:serine/threonine protein kinase